MFVSASELVKARKKHRCTWCGQHIEPGEEYAKWASVDDSWFTNKMHVECLGALHDEIREGGDNEYIPYDNERPLSAEHTNQQPEPKKEHQS